MNCLKAQSMITPFINNKLNINELEDFLDHVNTCPNCKEELEVYYALLTAMKQLDEDKNLSSNFVQELNEKLELAEEQIIHAKYTYYRKIAILILTMILLAFFISISYANKSEEENTVDVRESDFHMRYEFRDLSNPTIDLQLQEYMKEHSLEQIIPEE